MVGLVDKIITIELLGQEYQFRVDPQREDAWDIANYLRGKVEEVRARVKNMSDHKIIMLAALDISSDYYRLRREFEAYRGLTAERSKRLTDRIDMQI